MVKSSLPRWYSHKYPTMEDLEKAAESFGCLIDRADIGDDALYIVGEGTEPPMILLPIGASILLTYWLLAHEIAHLYLHSGPKGRWSRDEPAADRWAACALIPSSRILAHRNASEDAFIGAISAHYQEIPLNDCPERRLASKIAKIRLYFLEDLC